MTGVHDIAISIRLNECSFSPCTISQIAGCVLLRCPPLTKRVVTRIPGVCCPNVSCVNLTTCEVNNVTYNVGDVIPQKDPCVNW